MYINGQWLEEAREVFLHTRRLCIRGHCRCEQMTTTQDRVHERLDPPVDCRHPACRQQVDAEERPVALS